MKANCISILLLFISYNGLTQDCSSTFLFHTVGGISFGLAKDQDFFWVSDNNIEFTSSAINMYDETGTYVKTILVEPGIANAIVGLELVEDTLWAVKEQSSELLKLNKLTGELYAVYDLPSFDPEESNNVGIAFDGSFLWNSEHFSPNDTHLFKIDPANGAILDTINVNLDRLMPLEYVNGKMVGITVDDDVLYEIDLSTGEATFLLDWCIDSPFDLTYNAIDDIIYGLSIDFGTNSVYRVKGLEFLTTTVSAQDINEDVIKVYPNPVQDFLEVHFPTTNEYQLQILNAVGSICFQSNFTGNELKRNIEHYPPGIYYLLTHGNGKRTLSRFIKV